MNRLLLFALAGYLGYRVLKGIWKSVPEQKVKGSGKSKPLDVDPSKISDAHYQDIDNEKKKTDDKR